MPLSYDLVCFSHLRWDFVFQRPQHLLSRCAREHRVFFVEEPVYDDGPARLETSTRENGVQVVVPHLREGVGGEAAEAIQQALLEEFLRRRQVDAYVAWYYTPMALGFTAQLRPLCTVYDCMDELSAFRFAPPALKAREAELLRRADLVFTGGQSLYEAKRDQHPRVSCFPSSVDVAHFARARRDSVAPADQAAIPSPRLGFFGVIDERMDIDLLAAVAAARPEWGIVMVGPMAKVDAADLPHHANIHYLGAKSYAELPEYLAGWDVALLPFALNESTRFISPTKTPEYLAAGKPVVSTPICDVVRPYGEQGLVRIAATPAEFVAAVEAAMAEDAEARIARSDAFLAQGSWDDTWARMEHLIRTGIGVSPTLVARPAALNPAGTPGILGDISTRVGRL